MTEQKDLADEIFEQCLGGRWGEIASINIDLLANRNDRMQLVALLGVAKLRVGLMKEAKECFSQVIEWQGNTNAVVEAVLSSVHQHLALASLALNDLHEAVKQFLAAYRYLRPSSALAGQAYVGLVNAHLKLDDFLAAFYVLEAKFDDMSKSANCTQTEMKILATELQTIRHELALAQQRGQIVSDSNQLESQSDLYENNNIDNISMSQLGQDIWVLEKTNFKTDGFFVEFGATDGVLLSNTWLLEKKYQWKGICAEPNPKFFSDLKKNRNCIVSDACIGKNSGEKVRFIFADVYGGVESFMNFDSHGDKRKAYQSSGKFTDLITISLNDFLILNNCPKNIDYISIDIEGGEFDVLSGFPFDNWNVRLFTVEHNYSKYRDDVEKLMAKNGYRRTKKKWDDWYEKVG